MLLILTETLPEIGVTKGEVAPQGQKLKPKTKNRNGLFGELPVARAQPQKHVLSGHENALKMHTLSINFISFTAQIYNALHIAKQKEQLLASWRGGHGPPKSAYVVIRQT